MIAELVKAIVDSKKRDLYWDMFWHICGTIFYAVVCLSLIFETHLVRGFVRGFTIEVTENYTVYEYHTLFHYVPYSTIIGILVGIIWFKDARRWD